MTINDETSTLRARAREARVLNLLEGGMNYRDVAKIIGGTRNAVAGLAFRATLRNMPEEERARYRQAQRERERRSRERRRAEKSEAPEGKSEASNFEQVTVSTRAPTVTKANQEYQP